MITFKSLKRGLVCSKKPEKVMILMAFFCNTKRGCEGVSLCLVSKEDCLQNVSSEIEFDLHESEPVAGTHFHTEWFRTRTRFDIEAKLEASRNPDNNA